jgi:hypothetical protein
MLELNSIQELQGLVNEWIDNNLFEKRLKAQQEASSPLKPISSHSQTAPASG